MEKSKAMVTNMLNSKNHGKSVLFCKLASISRKTISRNNYLHYLSKILISSHQVTASSASTIGLGETNRTLGI